jgi:hypothetical protein
MFACLFMQRLKYHYPKLECSDAEKVHDTNAMQNLIFSILDWNNSRISFELIYP